MNLRIFESLDDLTTAAARTIVQRLQPGVAASIALSGGKSPERLFAMLGRSPWRAQLAKSPITWVVVDERYVPIEHPDSNAGMIQRTLFAEGLLPGHRFLRFRTELNDPEATAAAFETEWRDLGLEQLDVVHLGVGDDGHTASLFPGTPVLEVEDRIAAAVFVPRLDAWRVTLTKPVLRAAKLRLVIATGASKARIIQDVQAGVSHPIALVTAGDLETWWLVDRAAIA
jgi:6-phosphogluconolactonase